MSRTRSRHRRRLAAAVVFAVCLAIPAGTGAQRALFWDALDVEATLDADGALHVLERQSFVFSGDYNGGERSFNLRPRQRLALESLTRVDDANPSEAIVLNEDADLDDVNEYAFTDRTTLRWRSRLPSDPPFEQTRIRYDLRYTLSRILQKKGDDYVLDHDFAFPDRDGAISHFRLRLTLDPVWQAAVQLRDQYEAGPLPPGESFVLTMPMRYTGSGTPQSDDGRPPREIQYAVALLGGVFALSLIGWYVREQRLGRFEPVRSDHVTPEWIAQHIVAHPAELVGAAWDDSVGREEVVALLARMTGEGTLTSEIGGGADMALRLNVDRGELDDYERALVDGLFFDGRTSTSTGDVKAHYKSRGFDPAAIIRPGLEARLAAFLPKGTKPRASRWVSAALFFLAVGLLVASGVGNDWETPAPIVVGVAAIVLAGLLQIPGSIYNSRVDWGVLAAALCFLPVALLVAGVGVFLWWWAGTGAVELSNLMLAAVVTMAVWSIRTGVNGMKSTQNRETIAFRKLLTAGRQFFARELTRERPALRDEWYPWVLAFGLSKQADAWSVVHASDSTRSRTWHGTSSGSTSTTSESAGPSVWTGGGGRSGGAGASAGWAAAAAGMAAGVSAPSSSSSSGGSSSGGSSGGGGGGGW
jgi:uncharacterized membrane protein YgcG